MKNHIVSQMIIKRFANAINVFDVKNGSLNLNKKPNKVFYKVDRLPEELEKTISKYIESPFANLLYGKLNNDCFVTLKRSELFVIKRYLLMISIRMFDENEFAKMMDSFKNNAERYLSMHPECLLLKRNSDLGLSNKELYLLALEVFCNHKDIKEIMTDSRATLEMICWAMPFIDSYLAIWDAPQGMEYVLSDCSMVSEYEGCHQITGGLDMSKVSYLHYKLINGEKNDTLYFYADLISKMTIMYENYNVFNLSSKRSLVLINPFFRQYFGCKQINQENHETIVIEKPDMWPSVLQNKKLFKTPVNEYKSAIPGMYLDDDLFFYEVQTLSPDELVYINSLIISMTHDTLGFNEPKAILDSINYSIWSIANYMTVKNDYKNDYELSKTFFDNIVNSSLFKLSVFCSGKKSNYKPKIYFIPLFDTVVQNILKDFNENKYIYYYLLHSEQNTRESQNLSFLGTPETRIMNIKKKYKQLWGKPYDK